LLTTIVTIDPMYVYFDIDARTMLLIQERIRAGKFKSARHNRDVVVRIGLENMGFEPDDLITLPIARSRA
jgi:hypothetical protein